MAKGLWRWALMTMILTMTRVRQSVTSDSFHIRLSFSFSCRERAGYRKEPLTCFCFLFGIFRFTKKLRRRARATWYHVFWFHLSGFVFVFF